MKTTDTFVEDVYGLLDTELEHEHSNEMAAEFAMRVGGEFARATRKREGGRVRGKLWASDLGKPCPRYHYYNFHQDHDGEKLDGHTRFKFLYGNLLEECILYLGREAGHEVEHLQESVKLEFGDWTVSGRIDCTLDKSICDVKSASTYSFNKYRKEGITDANDSFGYLYQLAFYKHFNEIPDCNNSCGFLFIDKQNGHISYLDCTDYIPTREEIEQRVLDIIRAAEGTEDEAERYYSAEPYGKSGNMALPISCSYCSYKHTCWRDANGGVGLRGFAYNHKPVWFTEIKREPRVPELTGDDDE